MPEPETYSEIWRNKKISAQSVEISILLKLYYQNELKRRKCPIF